MRLFAEIIGWVVMSVGGIIGVTMLVCWCFDWVNVKFSGLGKPTEELADKLDELKRVVERIPETQA